MNLSKIIKLYLHLLFCQRASSSRDLFFQNEPFPDDTVDNILAKYFVDLYNYYLEKYMPRHIMVVGPSINILQQVQPLFERYPYMICEAREGCDFQQEIIRGSFVIVFLEDLTNKTLETNINILSRFRECRILFLYNGAVRFDDISSVFTMTMQRHIPYSKFAHVGRNIIEIYSTFIGPNCTMEVELVNVWRSGVDENDIKTWSFQRAMNGCPVSVSSLTFTPKMIIEENEYGVLTAVAGREGKLLLAIASKLNFTINLRYPSVADRIKYSRKVAIVHDVSSGISDIGIGRLRPLASNDVVMSLPYDEECITWGVPRVMRWSDNIVWVEFTWEVWALVALMFAIMCIMRYIYSNTFLTKYSALKRLGCVRVVLDGVLIHLGYTALYRPSSAGGRFMLLGYMGYAMIMTTAYKTSLAAILSTSQGTPTIANAQGIIDANIKVSGSLYDYNVLKDQVDESEVTSKLLDRFVIDNNDSVIWDQLFVDKDTAILGRRTYLNYCRQVMLRDHESATFNILDGCVLAYPTVMIYRTKWLLQNSVDHTIRHLEESGILGYWDLVELDNHKLPKSSDAADYSEKREAYKLWNIFILYSTCIIISLLTFFIELITFRLDLRKLKNAGN